MSSAAEAAAVAAFTGGPQQKHKPTQRKPLLDNKLDYNGARVPSGFRCPTPVSVKTQKMPVVPLEGPLSDIKASKDDQAAHASDHDYFYSSNNVSSSSHDLANLEASSRPRISSNTRSQDMLRPLRAKSKTVIDKESVHKDQMDIADFRNSVEKRRQFGKRDISPNNTSATNPYAGHKDDYNRAPSVSLSFRQGSHNLEVPYSSLRNDSVSSLYSVESEAHERLLAPTARSVTADGSSEDERLLSRRRSVIVVSPTQIIPCPNALPRGIPGTNASMPQFSILTEYLSSGSDAADHFETKTRLGRKPPPDLLHVLTTEGRLCSSSVASISSDQEDAAGRPGASLERVYLKLSLGADMSARKSDEGLGRDPNPSGFPVLSRKFAASQTHYKSEETDQPQFPSAHVAGQPVKLKTTLRKMSKKQEKKTFNEDKPWKNHGDLDALSDLQRKRYEGLWVSNKGLYVNRTVTRLVGVNYDREERRVSKSLEEKKDLSEKEVSEYAAKLSSRTNYHLEEDSNDTRQLHGLDEADMQELIYGVVVRRIWMRSKLLNEVLGAIWDLVDYRRDGTLNKAEFLVGMWLVDQCLYGRKLPKTVSNSVWLSVGSVGLSVVMKKKRW